MLHTMPCTMKCHAPNTLQSRHSRLMHSRPSVHSRRRCQAITSASMAPFIPAEEAKQITEPAAQNMLRQYKYLPLDMPAYPTPVQTAVVPPQQGEDKTPIVLLHGFDSSSLEFRRLKPQLSNDFSPWGVDLLGWGFTDCGFGDPSVATTYPLGPEQKRQHLYTFWKQHINRPMVLLGTSLGATIAMDFAIEHPEAVSHLVLLCPQVSTDGVPSPPRPLAWLGVQVLKSVPLRQYANKLAYYDDEKYATEDALLCGRLHTHLPGWVDMNIAFMQSGGYKIIGKLQQVTQPTLVVWGRHDEILNPNDAETVVQQFQDGKLLWAENSGHCPHLEEPAFVVQQVREFVGVGQTASA